MKLTRVLKTLNSFNNLGLSTSLKGINRLAFTHNERLAALKFSMYCQEEGLKVHFDGIGNVIARREGRYPDLPPVLIGSHIDTVPEGGRYDGLLGVVGALEFVRYLNDQQIETDHPIEIVAFTCEESARFNVATLGNRYYCGNLSKEDMENLSDQDGKTLYEVIQETVTTKAADLSSIPQPKAYIELHIEQGPVLEKTATDIGIVTHIAAPQRFKLTLQGVTSHSGATPMMMRQDALTCASEIITHIEAIGQRYQESGLVATVGHIDIRPNTMNAIPGEATLFIDLRSIDTTARDEVATAIEKAIVTTTRKRDITYTLTTLTKETPTNLSQPIGQIIESICQTNEISYQYLFSGAGHDAMQLAKCCPTSMIFIPCEKGISHSPDESVTDDQIRIGVDVLIQTALQLSYKTTQLSS